MAIVKRGRLAQAARKAAGLTRRAVRDLAGSLFEAMVARLVAGERVKIYGFDSFLMRDMAARPGRNPCTLEAEPIAARLVVVFKSSGPLKKRAAKGLPGGGNCCRDQGRALSSRARPRSRRRRSHGSSQPPARCFEAPAKKARHARASGFSCPFAVSTAWKSLPVSTKPPPCMTSVPASTCRPIR